MGCLNIEETCGRYKASDGQTLFMDYVKTAKDNYNISSKFYSSFLLINVYSF